jgi:hypothetical protein
MDHIKRDITSSTHNATETLGGRESPASSQRQEPELPFLTRKKLKLENYRLVTLLGFSDI